MKILKKRAFALIIDSFVFAFFAVPILELLPEWVNQLGGIVYIPVFIPFFCRDIVFRNASIGKKIMGIAVYDKNWHAPKFRTLIFRSFLTSTVVYVMAYKAKFIDGNMMSVIDWEREHIKTMVIDKNILTEIKQSFIEENGKELDADQITKKYNAYLRDIYLKR